MRVRALMTGTLAAAAMAGSVGAQQRVDVRRATGGSGPLDVHLVSGEVRLVGWNRNEVHVTGELSEDGDRIEVASQGDRFVVRVQPPRITAASSASPTRSTPAAATFSSAAPRDD